MRPRRAAFPRFVVVGAITAIASMLGVWALVELLGIRPLVAAGIVAIVGNLWGFCANRQWSFRATHDAPARQLGRYAAVALGTVLSSVVLFGLFTDLLGVHYLAASLVVSGLFAIVNFLAHFHWSFAQRKTPNTST